jgi:hypothetical protein
MNPTRRCRQHHTAEFPQAAAKVDILKPAVQRQRFIEKAPSSPNSTHSHCHVTAISVVNGEQIASAPIGPSICLEILLRFVHPEAWTDDAIGDDMTSGQDNIRMGEEQLLYFCEISWLWQEVVIKEHNDIETRSLAQDPIALFGEPDRRRNPGNTGSDILVRNPTYVRAARSRYEDCVRNSRLRLQPRNNGLSHCGTALRGDTHR